MRMLRTMWIALIVTLMLRAASKLVAQAPQKDVVLDGQSTGRIFDGIGAVSAGASSRLLIDYPEPYRSQILDYLFRPHYGASLQHLKIEIGGDVNSTDGSEPSHMRSPDDKNFTRGYEWWLMQEAHRRNPKILLDTLAWGAPGWVGSGGTGKPTLYTPAMAHYVAVFLNGGQSQYDLNIPYTGSWNETQFDAQYIKTLRGVLDNERPGTKIVCCDEYPNEGLGQWSILDAMLKDPALSKAVDVISVHYTRENGKLTTPADATSFGKPVWSSEDQPESSASHILSRDWAIGGRSLAQLYNENYLQGHFTKTEIWSPVTSYYDILAAPNSGLMYANTPWSGNYSVQGSIWATAHTTQFAQPGWTYDDPSCGYLARGGSFVTLLSPDRKNWSTVIESIDAHKAQTIRLRPTQNGPARTVHVWLTNASTTFSHVTDLYLAQGAYTLEVRPDSIYTVTTTTGQGKGDASPPPPASFPIPYSDAFDSSPLSHAARYLADQDGAFEVQPCRQRNGNCLTQVI